MKKYQMKKKSIKLKDGRKLIFYSFRELKKGERKKPGMNTDKHKKIRS